MKKNKIVEGYSLIYKPDHKNCNKQGYVQEHRLVVENFIKRLLEKTEVIHHINGFKCDNRIDNLMIFKTQKDHKSFENKIRQFGYTQPIITQIENRWKSFNIVKLK